MSWKKDTNSQSEIEFTNIPSLLPADYFVISKTQTLIKIGYFLRETVNGSKLMIEIHLQLDSHYSLHVMGKEINLEKIGIQNNYSMTSESIKLLFEIIAQLRYCFGVTTLSKHNLPYFEEHVCIGGDENSGKIYYRSKTCAKVLSFKNSNSASSCCINCKKLKTRILLKEPICDINEEDNNDTSSTSFSDNDVMLGKSDHNDLSEILKTIFPECPFKMQTFLMSQKWL